MLFLLLWATAADTRCVQRARSVPLSLWTTRTSFLYSHRDPPRTDSPQEEDQPFIIIFNCITNHSRYFVGILVIVHLPQAELQPPVLVAPRHSRHGSLAAPVIFSFLIADLRPIQRVSPFRSCSHRGPERKQNARHAPPLSFAGVLRNREARDALTQGL